MTRRTDRRLALLAGGLLALFFTMCAAISVASWSVGTVEGNSTRTIAGPVDELVVESSNGDVTILRSDDGKIHIDGRAEGTLHAPAPRIEVDGSLVHVTANCPVWGFGDCNSEVILRVPGSTAVTVDAGSGDIVARDLGGAANLHTSSGDIAVDGSARDVTLDSGSGDIIARALSGDRAMAETASGDVDLRFAGPPLSADADTGSGDIRILVPSGVEDYRVEMDTGSGKTNTGVSESTSSNRLLRADSGSGDILIDYGG
ncbi:DUF4097 domain-containing protein [Solirubrobacter phytolaccae]|uniref:DUF4097 domain-containing protein n=1 Tax=Solirubrobacter phytolaccae TaxID=1404360 RepID=A0A9X3SEJ4_9ACTN|nr:DUF4097 family beta strand repeat-containing protein [Solirubrobacter phytolaccae]MDA0184940.1 DUF4097 domain-containing protein [Solirubrobacter phytolaccae]